MRWGFYWAARTEQKSLDTNGSRVSRAWKPSLPYEVVFGAPARELFAGVYHKVEKRIMNRTQFLTRKLNRATPDRMATRKLEILKAITSGSGVGPDKIS